MNKSLAVVVGRFQVANLHQGHLHLIHYAASRHERVLIVLGDHGGLPTDRDPLPFVVREVMVREAYPHALIARIVDRRDDHLWSLDLDAIIASHAHGEGATLYGSRDSFLLSYSGSYPTALVEELPGISGTTLRAQPSKDLYTNPIFRAGLIHAQALRLPVSYQVVDVAVLRKDSTQVLLGQKKTDGDLWRFVGGFVDPTDATLEVAALRELREEAGPFHVKDLTYRGSYRIADTRYTHASDKELSAFFTATYVDGPVTAGDDLARVAWHDVLHGVKRLIPTHRVLGEALLGVGK